MSPSASARTTWIVFAAAAMLFAPDIVEFEARPTDVSAMRVVSGDVPYRDFWTMYAPGSFYVVAGAFALFGERMILSNLLGAIAAAASVAVFHRLALRVAGPFAAAVAALPFAASFLGSDHHNGFTSYPPAILLILLAVLALAAFVETGRRSRLVLAGAALGLATTFKHDVAGYACLASALALLLRPGGPAALRRVGEVAILAGLVLAVALPPVLLLVAAGAGPDMWRDLVEFPLTDFRWAREEHFPSLVPSITGVGTKAARSFVRWAEVTLPLAAAVAALVPLWRRRASIAPDRAFLFLLCLPAFALFWSAAHVQINTHKVTMTALGALLAAAAFPRSRSAAAVAIAWALLLVAQPAYTWAHRWSRGYETADWPRLAGIQFATGGRAAVARFTRALEEAAPPEVPLFLVANRNDAIGFAQGVPFWMSARRPATRYHELHPAIADTDPVQREMLEAVGRGPLPVVVREHRFTDAELERLKARFLARGLPVGATLLDEWVERHYRPGPRFGLYEVMERRD